MTALLPDSGHVDAVRNAQMEKPKALFTSRLRSCTEARKVAGAVAAQRTGKGARRRTVTPAMPAQRGFTLLEMLAALMVLAVCCAVLLTAFGQSAKSLQQVEGSDRLNLAARSVLDEVSSGPLAAGQSSGDWDGQVHWQLDVSTQPESTAKITLYRLDLSVSEGRRRARFSTLQTRSASLGAQQ